MAKKLTEEHPLTIKLRELEIYMSDLNISIAFCNNNIIITDNKTKKSAIYKDLDSNEGLSEFPHPMETKLIS